ncbi:hypothetical protein KCP77_11085 [Salmonella enterica subsp. enterica]|nr:hypothetical protein KCP77_11085 [Salmonella enterica subsp. enterica]
MARPAVIAGSTMRTSPTVLASVISALLFIKQLHINLLAGLHITGSNAQSPAGFRHCRHPPVQFGFFIFQRLRFSSRVRYDALW